MFPRRISLFSVANLFKFSFSFFFVCFSLSKSHMASHKPVWSRLLSKPFLRSTNSNEKLVISANIDKLVINSERYRPKQKPAGFLKGVPRRLNFLHKLHVVTCVGARFILSALHIVSFWGAPNNLQIIKSRNQIGKTQFSRQLLNKEKLIKPLYKNAKI